jgi:hypothetical protein
MVWGIWQQFHPGFFAFSIWRFLLSCVMLLLPTTLMGATLPLLSSALLRTDGPGSTSVTRLYTRNLAGAICGSIIAGFVLLPNLGVRATIYIAALINILIGSACVIADRQTSSDIAFRKHDLPIPVTDTLQNEDEGLMISVDNAAFWLTCAFISGFVTISTQVAWTRMLAMIIGSSTYAFSVVVALFLLGLSLGAYVIARKTVLSNLRETELRVELVAVPVHLPVAGDVPQHEHCAVEPALLVPQGGRVAVDGDAPAAARLEHRLPVNVPQGAGLDDGSDDGVEAGCVTTAGEHTNSSHGCRH